MKHTQRTLLASLVLGLFATHASAQNITLGDTAITTGKNNIAIGQGAFSSGDNQTEAQIRAALAEQQKLAGQISSLKNSINGNEKLNQNYLDLVAQMERNQAAIGDLTQKLDGERERSQSLLEQHAEVQARYESQTQVIAGKKDIISRLDLSKVTGSWETDGGLDLLAKDFKKMAEAGTSVSFEEDFYKDYLKKYVNVATKVDHEGYKYDSQGGQIVDRRSSTDLGSNVAVGFEAFDSNQRSYKVDLLGSETVFVNRIQMMKDSVAVTEENITFTRERNAEVKQFFLKNYEKNIEKIRNSSDAAAMLWTDKYADKLKADILKEFDLAETSIRYKELELKLYNMNEADPEFNMLFKEFETMKAEKGAGEWGADRKRLSEDYSNKKSKYKSEMIIALQQENAGNIKKLNDALDAELTDITAEMKNIDSALSANQQLIAEYEKDIQNRQPTAAEKAAYEEAKKVQAKLDAERQALLEKERDLAELQKEMNKGKNAIAVGTDAIATGENAIALGKGAEAFEVNTIAIGANAQAKQSGAVAIGQGAVANAQAGDVALGAGSSTQAVIATGVVRLNGQDYAVAGANPASTVSIGSKGHERTLTNVAAGQVAADSTDAINGSQLHVTHTVIEDVTKDVVKNKDDLVSFGVALDKHLALITGRFDSLGSGTVASLGGGAKYDRATGAFYGPNYLVQGKNHDNVGSALGALNDQVTHNNIHISQNKTNITNINQGLADGTIGLVQQDQDTGVITVGKDKGGREVSMAGTAGDRVISGVAKGSVAEGSSQAVNGGQLWATEQNILNKIDDQNTNTNNQITVVGGNVGQLGKDTASALGGDAVYDEKTGQLSAPNYQVQGKAHDNVGSALRALDSQVTNNTTNIAQNKTDINNINQGLANGTIGLVQQDQNTGVITVGKDKGGSEVSMAGTAGDRVISGVGKGSVAEGSNQAVNGGQLWTTEQKIADLKNEFNSSNVEITTNINHLEQKTDGLGQGVAASLGGGAKYNQDTGLLSAPTYQVQGSSHNNVGSALTAVDNQIRNNTVNIAQNKTEINHINQGLAEGTIGLVQQDQASGVITVGKTKAGDELNVAGTTGERTITGVADGQIEADSKEAINGGQMYQMQAKFDTQIREYFKQGDSGRFNELEASVSKLNDKVNRNRKNASQGIAAAMAMQIDMPEQEPNQWAGGVGVATYDGQTAMALGLSYVSGSGRQKFSTSVGGGLNQGSKPAAKVSLGFLF